MQKNRRAQASPTQRPVHQVRIIGGQWKRTPLKVLDAEGLRPTPDRVRETVFNWLNHLIGGDWPHVACLDLFAGTGALGFEAASRGAASVLMIEKNPAAVRQLEDTRTRLGAHQVRILRGDAIASAQSLAAESGRFQVIFLDPPYHQGWLAKALPVCSLLLAAGGLVYAESETSLEGDAPPDWMEGWKLLRADKAGMVFFCLLQRNSDAEFQA